MTESDKTIFILSHDVRNVEGLGQVYFVRPPNLYCIQVYEPDMKWISVYKEQYGNKPWSPGDCEDIAFHETKQEAIDWCIEHWSNSRNHEEIR